MANPLIAERKLFQESQNALVLQTAKAQQLEHALKQAQAQLAHVTEQRDTVEAQLKRVYGDLDAARESRARLVRAYRKIMHFVRWLESNQVGAR